MTLISKDFSTLNTDSVARLTALGYTDAQFDGTTIRNLTETIDLHLADVYDVMKTNLSTQYLSQASGQALASLALLVGITPYAGESSANLRARTGQAISSAQGTNIAALVIALLSLNTVSNVIPRPYTAGVGSISLYLEGTSGQVDAATLALAQSLVDSIGAGGAYVQVTQPTPVLVNIVGTLSIVGSPAAPIALSSTATRAAVAYLASLSMGTPFIYNAFLAAIINADPAIIDVTITTISTTSASGQTTEQLLANFTPAFDEQLYPGQILLT
jgi:hypothetical protein